MPYGNLEDYYLWLRMIVKGFPVCNIKEVVLQMRVDEGLYQRRGRYSNINYFYHLRKLLYEYNFLTWYEKILGDWIITLNILIPGWMRKFIYKHVLHKNDRI